MLRFLGVATALFAGALSAIATAHAGTDRTLPMRFDLRQQGPSDSCGASCQIWIAASGAITAETPRDFQKFIEGRDLRGVVVTLDSDGGSVLGAMALGREIRRLNLATTVGRLTDLPADKAGAARSTWSPRADCESMCTFVLLAGVRRTVPVEARVMVHQIWLGDRREDPTAATYSAEDLVLVQRDIGRLVQYTHEMGGPSELLEMTLRIPPWEPMRALSREELKKLRLDNDEPVIAVKEAPPAPAAAAVTPASASTSGSRAIPISDRHWQVVDRAGVSALARRHSLTVEGEDIGSFDLVFTCDAGGDFQVSYAEQRHGGESFRDAGKVTSVAVRVAGISASLKVNASNEQGGELTTVANTAVPASLMKAFTVSGPRSLTVTTQSRDLTTIVRLGNTGAAQSLQTLISSCGATQRADVPSQKTAAAASR